MKKIILSFFTLILLISTIQVSAIGIKPSSVLINFVPNHEEIIGFKSTSSNSPNIKIEGTLSEYFSIEENNIAKDGTFTIKVKLPDKIDTPGDNVVFISLTEIKDETGMLSARASIRTPIVIRVPYPGSYSEIGFNAPDMNINETKAFTVTINNKGKEDIKHAKAIISIYTLDDKRIDILSSEEKPVKAGDSIELKALFDPSRHSAGTYKAIAHVTYDANSKDIAQTFRIGILDIKLTNYTKEFIKGKISKFNIRLESGWNSIIRNVHAEVKILNNSKLISSFKTISTELNPWEIKDLSTFWDHQTIDFGEYDVEIELHYENKVKKVQGKINIIKEHSSRFNRYFNLTNVLIAIIILLVIAIILKSSNDISKKQKTNKKPNKIITNKRKIKKRK